MPISIQNQRSAPGYKSASNNLMVHLRNYFELKELANTGIMMVDRSGDSIDPRTLSSIGKNLEANIMLELNSATELLSDLEAGEQVLRGAIAPSVAQASHPAPVVMVAGSILQSGRSLDRLELDSPESAQARQVDRKAVLGELEEITSDLKQTVSDLAGLQQSIEAKRFVGFPDCKTWANAVSTTTEFLAKKYKDLGIYTVPQSKLGG